MSDYFIYSPLTANTVARAADVNSRFAGVEAGFNLLPPPEYLSEDRLTFATDTGVADAYISNPDVPLTAYNVGLHLTLLAGHNNTGISTINVSGLGVKEIIRADGSSLEAGDIVAGQVLDLHYDGTAFRLAMAFAELSPAGVAAKIAAAGDIVINGNVDAGYVVATGLTIGGVTLDAPTAFGVSLVEAANAGAARALFGLGTMALETAASYLTAAGVAAAYAPLASPPLTGTPTAPTAAPGTNTTQLATTAFVTSAVTAAGSVSDTAYGVGWDGATTTAPSKNAVYDKIEAVVATIPTFTLSDAAYGVGWNGVTTAAPSKNAVYDQFEAAATAAAALVSDAVYGVGWDGVTTIAPSKNAVYDKIQLVVASIPAASDTAYGAGWNGDTTGIASKNAIYDEMELRAPKASPALTGAPTAPTAAAGTATTQLATTAFVDALRDLPLVRTAATPTLALADRGGVVEVTGATATIPANSSIAFPVGSVVAFYNNTASDVTLNITTDTLRLAGTALTGARTILARGYAYCRKRATTEWTVSGDVA